MHRLTELTKKIEKLKYLTTKLFYKNEPVLKLKIDSNGLN